MSAGGYYGYGAYAGGAMAPPPTPDEALAALKHVTKSLASMVGRADPAHVAQLRAEVQRQALALLEAAPVFAARAGVHSNYLWKHAIYGRVSDVRGALKRVVHPSGSRRDRVLTPEYAALAQQLQELVKGASRTLGGLLTALLALLGIQTGGGGDVAASPTPAAPALSASDARHVSSAAHMLLIYLGDLTRYAAECPVPAHPVRVTPACGVSELWETAVGAYIQAALLEPRSGHPHNQLAVVAKETRCAGALALRFMRSAATPAPFDRVREELQAAFEANRLAYDALLADPRVRRMGAVSAAHLVQDAYLIVTKGAGGAGGRLPADAVIGRRTAGGSRLQPTAAAPAAAAGAADSPPPPQLTVADLHIALVPRGHPAVTAGLPAGAAPPPLVAPDGSVFYPPPPAGPGGYVPTASDAQYHLLRGSVLERPWEALAAAVAFPPMAAYLSPPGSVPHGSLTPPRTALPLRRALLTWTGERVLRMCGSLALGTDLDRLPPLVRDVARDVGRLVAAASADDAAVAVAAALYRRPSAPPSGPVLPAGFLLRQVTMLLWAVDEATARAAALAGAAGAAAASTSTSYQPGPEELRRVHVRACFARYTLLGLAAAIAKAARQLLDDGGSGRGRRRRSGSSVAAGGRRAAAAAGEQMAVDGDGDDGSDDEQHADTQPIDVDDDDDDGDGDDLDGASSDGGDGGGGAAAGRRRRRDSDDRGGDGDSSGSDSDGGSGGGGAGAAIAAAASGMPCAAAAPLPPHVTRTLNACLAALGVVCDWLASPANAAALSGPTDAHLPAVAAVSGSAAGAAAGGKAPPVAVAAAGRAGASRGGRGGAAVGRGGSRGGVGGKDAAASVHPGAAATAAALADGDPDKLMSLGRRTFLDALAGLSNRLAQRVAPALVAAAAPASAAAAPLPLLRLLAGVVPGAASVAPPADVFPHAPPVAATAYAAALSSAASTPVGIAVGAGAAIREAPPDDGAGGSFAAAASTEANSTAALPPLVRPALVEEIELRGFGVAPLASLYGKLPLPYVPLRASTAAATPQAAAGSDPAADGSGDGSPAAKPSLPGDVALVLVAREGASYTGRAEPADFNPALQPALQGCLPPLSPSDSLGVRAVKVLRLAQLLATRLPGCALARNAVTGSYVTAGGGARRPQRGEVAAGGGASSKSRRRGSAGASKRQQATVAKPPAAQQQPTKAGVAAQTTQASAAVVTGARGGAPAAARAAADAHHATGAGTSSNHAGAHSGGHAGGYHHGGGGIIDDDDFVLGEVILPTSSAAKAAAGGAGGRAASPSVDAAAAATAAAASGDVAMLAAAAAAGALDHHHRDMGAVLLPAAMAPLRSTSPVTSAAALGGAGALALSLSLSGGGGAGDGDHLLLPPGLLGGLSR